MRLRSLPLKRLTASNIEKLVEKGKMDLPDGWEIEHVHPPMLVAKVSEPLCRVIKYKQDLIVIYPPFVTGCKAEQAEIIGRRMLEAAGIAKQWEQQSPKV